MRKEEPRNREVGESVQKPGQKTAAAVSTQPGWALPGAESLLRNNHCGRLRRTSFPQQSFLGKIVLQYVRFFISASAEPGREKDLGPNV